MHDRNKLFLICNLEKIALAMQKKETCYKLFLFFKSQRKSTKYFMHTGWRNIYVIYALSNFNKIGISPHGITFSYFLINFYFFADCKTSTNANIFKTELEMKQYL